MLIVNLLLEPQITTSFKLSLLGKVVIIKNFADFISIPDLLSEKCDKYI